MFPKPCTLALHKGSTTEEEETTEDADLTADLGPDHQAVADLAGPEVGPGRGAKVPEDLGPTAEVETGHQPGLTRARVLDVTEGGPETEGIVNRQNIFSVKKYFNSWLKKVLHRVCLCTLYGSFLKDCYYILILHQCLKYFDHFSRKFRSLNPTDYNFSLVF